MLNSLFKKRKLNRGIVGLLPLLFLLLLLAGGIFAFKGLKGKVNLRPKATLDEQVFKTWDFAGTTTEGWQKTNLSTGNVKDDYMFTTVVSSSKNSILQNDVVFTELPLGAKKIKLNFKVGDPTSKVPATPSGKPFTAEIRYMFKGTSSWKGPLNINGVVNSEFTDYEVTLPEQEKINISKLQILFLPLPSRTQVWVDWIRLTTIPAPEPSPTPVVVEDIDPQTLEMYDLKIEPSVTTVKRDGSGHLYGASVIFRLWGERIKTYKTMFGYLQKTPPLYGDSKIIFDYKGEGYPRFLSTPVLLFDDNCIDLYKSEAISKDNYVATFCYRTTPIVPNQTNGMGSNNMRLVVRFKYVGVKVTTMLFLTTAFNKYNNNLPPYDGTNRRGTRVNYLTIDSDLSRLSDFKDVLYSIDGLTSGLNEQDYYSFCWIAPGLPKKYLKQTNSNPKPEGGNNLDVTGGGANCGFQYKSNYLVPFYLSLWKDGSTTY